MGLKRSPAPEKPMGRRQSLSVRNFLRPFAGGLALLLFAATLLAAGPSTSEAALDFARRLRAGEALTGEEEGYVRIIEEKHKVTRIELAEAVESAVEMVGRGGMPDYIGLLKKAAERESFEEPSEAPLPPRQKRSAILSAAAAVGLLLIVFFWRLRVQMRKASALDLSSRPEDSDAGVHLPSEDAPGPRDASSRRGG
ncbi:MAG: hypothetical protein V1918_09315 [Planctomycetota bacterium]